MVKQVVIQLQDFDKDVSDVALPDEQLIINGTIKFENKTPIQINNPINLSDFELTNEIARQAFINYISSTKNCCWLNKSYSKKLRVLRIEYSFIYLYTLETFTEKRQTCFNFLSDFEEFSPSEQEIPEIWSIKSEYDPIPFVDHYEVSVIPNSEMIKFCKKCNGTQKRTCSSCLGIKKDKTCLNCDDKCLVACETCKTGKLKWFQSLKIIWRNHVDKFRTKSPIPDEEFNDSDISGTVLYEDNGFKINPINFMDNVEITKASERFVKLQEETNLQKEKLIEQRQELRAIKLATVYYQYGRKLGKYWLFYDKIDDLKVYAIDYSNCCLGCFIC